MPADVASKGYRGMWQFDEAREYPVGRDEAFAFLTQPACFPRYWPRMRGVRHVKGDWTKPGDQLEVDIHVSGALRTLHMTLDQYVPPHRLVYRSTQKGLPDARHERHFSGDANHCRYRLFIQFQPRPGLVGLYDRYIARLAVKRTLRVTLRNLDRIFAAGEHRTDPAPVPASD